MAETNPVLADQNTYVSWKRSGKTQQKDHEDRIAGKGLNTSSHHNLVHKFIFLCPK